MKQIVGSIAAAMLITAIPLGLRALFPDTHWWRTAAAICDCPMRLIHSYNFGHNELTRLLIFLLVNVMVWSFVTYVVLLGLKKSIAR